MTNETLLVAKQTGNYDGAYIPTRGMKDGSMVVAQSHGKYTEAVLRGNCFLVNAKTITVTATTDISPLPATTGRVGIGVYNPATSTNNVVLLKVQLASVSGTPGGPAYLDQFYTATLAMGGATSPTGKNAFVGMGTVSQAYGLVGAVPAQAVAGTQLRTLGGPAAIAAGAGLYDVLEDIDGSIVIAPGYGVAVTWHAVGTTHIYSASILWEEIPVN